MNIPKDLRYAKSHEWVRLAGAYIEVGISDFAQHQLSDVTYVDLPEIGRKVTAGEEMAVVESIKAASDIYAPVSGTIAEVNEKLSNAPEVVNADPYGEGWMVRITPEPAGEGDLGNLLSADDYARTCEADKIGH